MVPENPSTDSYLLPGNEGLGFANQRGDPGGRRQPAFARVLEPGTLLVSTFFTFQTSDCTLQLTEI